MSPNSHSDTALSSTETWTLLALTAACGAVLGNALSPGEAGAPLVASLALSGIAFAASYAMIRWLGPTFIRAGLSGKDMGKLHGKVLPECMGAVCAAVYLLAIIVFTPFPFYKDFVAATSGGGNRDVVLHEEYVQQGRFLHRFPHSKVRGSWRRSPDEADGRHSWRRCPQTPGPRFARQGLEVWCAGADVARLLR